MELDFNKEKQRIAGLSDAELLARIRDPAISSTDRMLVEAEISRRGVDRRRVTAPGRPVAPTRSKRGSNFFSLVIVVGIVVSILAGILEDMGIDVIEWLREFFFGEDG